MAANRFFVLFVFFLSLSSGFSQKTKTQLEREKKENLRRIAEAERILQETESEKKVTLGQLQALNRQIYSRESLIRSIGAEIKLLDIEINDLKLVVEALQNDLKKLKEEYAEQIYNSYKANKGYSIIMFLFASKNFNQLSQRLKYLEQYSKARRLQADQIVVVAKELNDQKARVETKRAEQQTLLNQQLRENRKLAKSKRRQSQLVAQLSKKERELRNEVQRRKDANLRLNTLIAEIIKDEIKKSKNISTAEVASGAEVTRSFESSKNKLNWPVSGFISSKFGKQQHPVFKRIIIINDGVDIQTEKGSKVKAVFDGQVTMVAPVTGKNNCVVIRHGDYLTVYARLKTVNVKMGQRVTEKDIIGEVFTDRDGISELEFQVYKGTNKLNPENWLALK
ncbi:MAG: peptidoglycan DD-metalloendopeptidase family protein [Bacteroidota bacterium]